MPTENIFLCALYQFQRKPLVSTNLPGTETEVNAIAKLFSGNAKISTHEAANESAGEIGGGKREYHYLHFATHGVARCYRPALSRIFLSSEGKEDGSLYCGEIYNLTMNAESGSTLGMRNRTRKGICRRRYHWPVACISLCRRKKHHCFILESCG